MSKLIYHEYKKKEHFYDSPLVEPPPPDCIIPVGKTICDPTIISSFTINNITKIFIF